MRATRNSKPSRISKRIPDSASHSGVRAAIAVFLLLAILGAAAAAWMYSLGYILYYGDAEAHLETARRILDSRTPGYEQIGTPWLPLPHVLMLPFVANDWLWRTGLAGTIPGVFCFALAGTFLFASVRLLFGGTAPALCAALLFALNPNMLYLQSTPMTEPVLLACLMGVLYFSVRFGRTQSLWAALGAGVCALASTLARYDGWFLLPFVALYFLLAGGARRWTAAMLFCAVACAGPVYWLAHNALFEGDPLAFYRGPWSAKAIQAGRDYPGNHDLARALRYYSAAAELCAGSILTWIGVAGLAAAAWKRAWWALALLGLIPVFYVLSMYSSGTPIFVPHLWPNSYYNTRYGMGALPLLCLGGAALVALVPGRLAGKAAFAIVLTALLPWIAYPRAETWITWKESQVNSKARREWTARVAAILKESYRHGAGVLFSWGDLTGAFREAGIPLRETLHIGNGPEFEGAIARPDLMLLEEWVIAISADPVASAMPKTWRSGPHYEQMGTVFVQGGPVIEIHRRTHDHTLYQGARRPE